MRKKIAVFGFFFFLAGLAAFFRGLDNIDEIWNFTFASQMAQGQLPYRDFNLLQTPLSCLVNSLLLRAFGRQLIVIRAAGAVLFAASASLMVPISRRIGGGRRLSLIPGMALIMIFYWNIFLEYSGLIIFFTLLLIFSDLEMGADSRKRTAARYFLTGMIAGAAILSKQTYGVFIAAACLITAGLYGMETPQNGAGKAGEPGGDSAGTCRGRKVLSAVLWRLGGIALPCLCLLAYLLGTGTFTDFYDMAVAGIASFSVRLSWTAFLQTGAGPAAAGILCPGLCLAALFLGLRRRSRREGVGILNTLLYTLFSLINLYPLCNDYHLFTAFASSLVLLAPLLGLLTVRQAEGRRRRTETVSTALLAAGACIFLAAALPIHLYRTGHRLLEGVPHLAGIHTDEKRREELVMTSALIKQAREEGREFYILDNFACLYFLPHDIYHKNLDMFLYGNLGTATPAECLERSCKDDTWYLIAKKERANSQFPAKETEAFAEGLTFLREEGEFLLYQA